MSEKNQIVVVLIVALFLGELVRFRATQPHQIDN